jgi:hypothetical protein
MVGVGTAAAGLTGDALAVFTGDALAAFEAANTSVCWAFVVRSNCRGKPSSS